LQALCQIDYAQIAVKCTNNAVNYAINFQNEILELIFCATECKNRMHESPNQMHPIGRQSLGGAMIFEQHEPLSPVYAGALGRAA
jgi:hypothetical protein